MGTEPLAIGSAESRRDEARRGGAAARARSLVAGRLAPHARAYRLARSLHVACCRLVGPLHELPNLYIIGFPKCGTTSLHAYLAQHPDVRAGAQKEIRYFGHDERYARGINWYRSNFPLSAQRAIHERRRRADGKRRTMSIVDASVRYVNHPHAMRRIAAVTPNARFIAMVRDPIERAHSHYRANRLVAPEVPESLTFAEAIEAEEGRIAGEYERMERDEGYYSRAYFGYGYAANGRYARWLRPWLEGFPGRVMVIESGELRADAQGTMDRVAEFAGLPRCALRDTRERNAGGGGAGGIDGATRARLSEYYRGPNADLYGLLGRDLGWG
ncbi:MAG: sulfotransferase [Thaumarchaeota archaeon]|nr:sulfotransferase [Nitrososphaerota archaeon]MDD9826301.1 sulfotransferase [Nitrososphaerota archaeon]